MNRKERRRAAAISRRAGQALISCVPQRQSLLGAAGVLAIAPTGAARAQTVVPPSNGPCVVVGTTATCTGNVSTGVQSINPVPNLDTINVNNLTQAIAPANNIAGIDFQKAAGNIVINSDTGNFGIMTTGTGDGINAFVNGDGSVSVTSVGNITSGNRGIDAEVDDNGNVTVNSTGNIVAQNEGIRGFVDTGDGNVTITSVGNITSNANDGISAQVDESGDVVIRSTGNINAAIDGIYGGVEDAIGNVTIVSQGNITAGRHGIYGYIEGDSGINTITITSSGNITSGSEAILALNGDGDLVRGDIFITSAGNLSTQNNNSDAIYAYVTDDGNITINSTGNITTQGNRSDGIYAGVDRDGNISIISNGSISTQGNRSEGIYAEVGRDGDITIVSNGNITTPGDGAEGIYAIIARNGNISITSNGNIIANDDGIYGGVSGNGNVTINSTGNIASQNEEGIDAEVQGNGNISIISSGNIATNDEGIDATIRGAGGGNITIMSTGNVTSTTGTGIDAQITAGPGNVSITSNGNVTAVANGEHGVNAQVRTASTATVNLTGGTVQGGAGTGAGVNFNGAAGSTNILNTFGTITLSSLGGTAVGGGAGNTTVSNFGVLNTLTNGAVNLGGGTNALNNMAGATFNVGMTVNLGAGNLLTNSGTWSPGGSIAVATTNVTGNFTQTVTGELLTDVNLGATTGDLTNVTGTSNLAGNVRVQATNLALGPRQVKIFSAAGGTTNNGLGLIASPSLNASILFPNANDVVLSINLNFTAPGIGLNQNQINLGNYFNTAVGAGSGGLGPLLLGLINSGPTDVSGYLSALNQLLPEVYLNTETATLFSSEEFTNNLFSCRMAGRGAAFIRQNQCVWVRPNGRTLRFRRYFPEHCLR